MKSPMSQRALRWLAGRSPATSFGSRLVLILLPLSLLPVILMGLAAYQRSRAILREQADAQLKSTVEAEIQLLADWSKVREQRLQLGSQRSALREPLQTLVATPFGLGDGSLREAARAELVTLRAREGETFFTHILAVRLADGMIVVSTLPDWEGAVLPALTEGRLRTDALDTSSIFNDAVIAPGEWVVVSTVPMRVTGAPTPDSLLVGVSSGLQAAALMENLQLYWERRGVYRVERGQTFVVMAPDIVIQLERYGTAPRAQAGVLHPVFDRMEAFEPIALEYSDFDGVPVLGAMQWLPQANLGVVVELPQSDIFAGLNALAPFTITLVLAAAAATIIVVSLVATGMARPLGALSHFAERLASGDMTARVPVRRRDELGRLAGAFNFMADELSDLYRSLEDRVRARTHQIRTAAQVATEATAIRDVEVLLNQTVRLIAERFGFYHVGVFLVDPTGEWAELRAASSPGGQRMLQHRHRLAVGKVGLVGYVTGTGRARIALDVGEDAVHFANPDLPETRSELALPLRVGDQIIGALDVQSQQANAFAEEDVLVLQTMADQLAVAIQNARLLERHTQLAQERQKVIDLYHRVLQITQFDALLAAIPEEIRRAFGFVRVTLATVEGDQVIVRAASQAPEAGPPLVEATGPVGRGALGRAVRQRSLVRLDRGEPRPDSPGFLAPGAVGELVAVPLISRGQAIGSLAMETTERLRDFQLEIVELLSSQMGVALENARLFEETQNSLAQLDTLYRQQTGRAWEQWLASRLTAEEKTYHFGRPGDGGPKSTTWEIPIALRGEVIGGLELESKRPDEWTEEERLILQGVADEVAAALEQVRLVEEIERRATQLRAASEIARDATGLLDLDTLLSRAARLIRERFGFDQVSVYLLDAAGQVGMVRQAGEDGSSGEPPSADAVLSHVIRSGETSVGRTPGRRPGRETGAELGLPLKIGERVIGVLHVLQTRSPGFGDDDISVLQILADQLAVAVQNARLFEETLRRAEREQAVMEITSKIRQSGDVDAMLQTAVRELRQALGARRASVRLFPTNGESGNGGSAGEERPRVAARRARPGDGGPR